MIGNLTFGGGEQRLLCLARSIDRSRFEHAVVLIDEPDPSRPETDERLRGYAEAGVEVAHLRNDHSSAASRGARAKASRLWRRVSQLSGIIRRLGTDVVDAHMESAALIGVSAAIVTGRRRVVTLYHPQPVAPPRFWLLAQQFVLSNADLVITDSGVRAREIREAALLRRPELRVIPNGVSPLAAARSAEEVRHALALPKDPRTRVIGQISRLVGYKGHMILLEAARLVLREAPDAFFLLVGYSTDQPGYDKQLEQKAAALGITDRVRITGYPGPIGEVWSVIDIHVHASVFDSLPHALLEGMSLRKPAVATAVGGIPDAVVDGESGLLVPPGDAQALSRALLRFLQDPRLAQACGQAAYGRYLERYRAEMTARRLESCFLELVAADV